MQEFPGCSRNMEGEVKALYDLEQTPVYPTDKLRLDF